jgi:membrane-associated phospholipid phosphatase
MTGLADVTPAAAGHEERERRTGPRVVPLRLRRQLPWITGLTAVWVAAWAAVVWHTRRAPQPFRSFDYRLLFPGPSLQRVTSDLADLGDSRKFLAILAVVAALCAVGRSWRALAGALLSVGLVLLCVEVILKPLVDGRLRPTFVPTFPSGHTATATCLATFAILILGRRHGPLRFRVPLAVRVPIVVLAVLIGPAVGLSMVSVGAHSIVDVLGALPLGVALTLLGCAAVDDLTRRPASPRAR